MKSWGGTNPKRPSDSDASESSASDFNAANFEPVVPFSNSPGGYERLTHGMENGVGTLNEVLQPEEQARLPPEEPILLGDPGHGAAALWDEPPLFSGVASQRKVNLIQMVAAAGAQARLDVEARAQAASDDYAPEEPSAHSGAQATTTKLGASVAAARLAARWSAQRNHSSSDDDSEDFDCDSLPERTGTRGGLRRRMMKRLDSRQERPQPSSPGGTSEEPGGACRRPPMSLRNAVKAVGALQGVRARFGQGPPAAPIPEESKEEAARAAHSAPMPLRRDGSGGSGNMAARLNQATNSNSGPKPAPSFKKSGPRSGYQGTPKKSGMIPGTPRSVATAAPPDDDDLLDDGDIPDSANFLDRGSTLILLVQLCASLILVAAIVAFNIFNVLKNRSLFQIKWWRWFALALAMVSGRLVAGWCVKLVVMVIERNFLLRQRVLYFVYGLRFAVRNLLWLGIVTLVWQVLLDNKVGKQAAVVGRILLCSVVVSLFMLAKVFYVKFVANSFHRKAYFDRIQDALFHQYILQSLSGPCLPGKELTEDELLTDHHREHSPKASKPPLSHCGQQQSERPADKRMPTPSPTLTDQSFSFEADFPTLRKSATLKPSPTLKVEIPASNMSAQLGAGIASPPVGRAAQPIDPVRLELLDSETVSAWSMKKLIRLVRKNNMTTTTFEHQLREAGSGEIDSVMEARRAAKEIFYNVAFPGNRYLTRADFSRFLHDDQLDKAFALFEGAVTTGKVTRRALASWVVNAFKERTALSATLNDTKTVVGKLHRVLDFVVFVFGLITCLLILNISTSRLFVLLSTFLLPSVFVFSNAAKTTFEGIIFLFVMHPFDVGDRILVDGVYYVVEEMDILRTVLLTGSNEKVYYPNATLWLKPISNIYRSPDQWDEFQFQVCMATTGEQICALKERLGKYLEALPTMFYPHCKVLLREIEDSQKMKLAIYWQHKMNFQELGEKNQRRSNVVWNIKQWMTELKIGWNTGPSEVRVVGTPPLVIMQSQEGQGADVKAPSSMMI